MNYRHFITYMETLMLKSRKTQPTKPTLERKHLRLNKSQSWLAIVTAAIIGFKDLADLIHTLVEIYKAFN